ncbi:hypothetical protein BGZ61DRAFT_572480 [Ilyonectria robusta]|uniref:uncharacterized protein n=1 Tax=Ilyonectria robusta TaxID=1079257 RepID=UPI001E8E423C|nr:uncharacterized protein BGZ61DRAFT_572480 [Ilyonectria robusta]KAH8722150.1 hypothetical protein BGZ61DRAFT_572480 [Ilyonectria robusta]
MSSKIKQSNTLMLVAQASPTLPKGIKTSRRGASHHTPRARTTQPGVDSNIVDEPIIFKADPVTPTSRGVSLASPAQLKKQAGKSSKRAAKSAKRVLDSDDGEVNALADVAPGLDNNSDGDVRSAVWRRRNVMSATDTEAVVGFSDDLFVPDAEHLERLLTTFEAPSTNDKSVLTCELFTPVPAVRRTLRDRGVPVPQVRFDPSAFGRLPTAPSLPKSGPASSKAITVTALESTETKASSGSLPSLKVVDSMTTLAPNKRLGRKWHRCLRVASKTAYI